MAEQTPDSIITTQRNGQTIVAELFFNMIPSQIKAVAVFLFVFILFFSPWPCTYRSVQNRPSVPGSYHVPSDAASHNSA